MKELETSRCRETLPFFLPVTSAPVQLFLVMADQLWSFQMNITPSSHQTNGTRSSRVEKLTHRSSKLGISRHTVALRDDVAKKRSDSDVLSHGFCRSREKGHTLRQSKSVILYSTIYMNVHKIPDKSAPLPLQCQIAVGISNVR